MADSLPTLIDSVRVATSTADSIGVFPWIKARLIHNQDAVFLGIGGFLLVAFWKFIVRLGKYVWSIAWNRISRKFMSPLGPSTSQTVDELVKSLNMQQGDVLQLTHVGYSDPDKISNSNLDSQEERGSERGNTSDSPSIKNIQFDSLAESKRKAERVEARIREERQMPIEPFSNEEFLETMTELNRRFQHRWHNQAKPTFTKADGRAVLQDLANELEEIEKRTINLEHDARKSIVTAILSTTKDRLKTNLITEGQGPEVFYSMGDIVFSQLESYTNMWTKFANETIKYPKRIKSSELERYGFMRTNEDTAKHRKYHSFRYLCFRCKDWVSQASTTKYGSKDIQPHKYCTECYVATTRSDYELV